MKKTINYFFIYFVCAVLMSTFINHSYGQTSTQSSDQETEVKKDIDQDFKKLLEDSKTTQPNQSSLKDDVKIEIVKPSTSEVSKKSSDKYPKTTKEILVFSAVGFGLLILNFLGSIFLPNLRYLFIGVPFDLGVKEEKSDAQNAVKKKRFIAEFFLLLICVGIFYHASTEDKSFPDENLIEALSFSFQLFEALYLIYILIRLIWGFSTKCPSCKNMFAKKIISSWSEPKSTYTKKSTGTNSYEIREIGVDVSECKCLVCDYEWTVRSNYDRNKSSA
jgi:hypothetical protein